LRTLRHPSRLVTLLALLSTFLLGALLHAWVDDETIALSVTDDARTKESTVTLVGIRDGKLTGNMFGTVRLIVDKKAIEPNADGAFEIDARVFMINEVSVHVPKGTKFVASKRGTYFYPVDSARGQQLKPANRIYFATAKEALLSGFQAK